MTQWFGQIDLIALDCESQLLSLSPPPGARGPWRHLGLAAEERPHPEHPAPHHLPSSSGACINIFSPAFTVSKLTTFIETEFSTSRLKFQFDLIV